MNQIITDVPFGDGTIDAHMDTSGGEMEMDLGHLEGPDLTVTLDYATAKAILVDGNPQAGMQAFMAGKIKVQGDMTKLMAMQSGHARSRGQAEIAAKIKEITASSSDAASSASAGLGSRARAPCGAPSARRWLDCTNSAQHHAERGHGAADAGRPRRRPPPRPTAGSPARPHGLHHLDADDHADLGHHLLGGAGHAEVALVDGVGDAGRQRRRRAAQADARTGRASRRSRGRTSPAPRSTAPPSTPRRTAAPTTADGPLAHPHGDVAGQRAGDGEHQRPGDHQPADARLRVAEHRLEEAAA